jgi:putative NIF3 family GTP cyclohydrolase 1 type 2
MKVQELLDAITKKCGITVPENTVDRLIVGDPNQEVRGIGVTFMATADVIRRAAARGINTIITHEPSFFTHNDRIEWAAENPVVQGKLRLIADTGIAIMRFHDYTHALKPDLIYEGMIREMGWETYVSAGDQHIFDLPGWSIGELARNLKAKLGIPRIRLVGNEHTFCKRAGFFLGALSLGYGPEEVLSQLMQTENLDVLLCGEMLEWTTCAYARDAGFLGINRALLILGHNRSEEGGMKQLVPWLKPLCGGLPIQFVEAGDPFTYI